MWQLVFASRHRLILNNKNNNNNSYLKGCMMVMADPSDLGHGKNVTLNATKVVINPTLIYLSKELELPACQACAETHEVRQVRPHA